MDRRDIHLQNTQILNNKSIDTNIVEFSNQLLDVGNFIFVYNCIQSNIDLHAENMCILHKACNIFNRIAGGLSRTKAHSTNIYSIGTVVNGGNARFIILCRSKKLYLSWKFLHNTLHNVYFSTAKIQKIGVHI